MDKEERNKNTPQMGWIWRKWRENKNKKTNGRDDEEDSQLSVSYLLQDNVCGDILLRCFYISANLLLTVHLDSVGKRCRIRWRVLRNSVSQRAVEIWLQDSKKGEILHVRLVTLRRISDVELTWNRTFLYSWH